MHMRAFAARYAPMIPGRRTVDAADGRAGAVRSGDMPRGRHKPVEKPPCASPSARPTNDVTIPTTMTLRCAVVDEMYCA